MSLKEALKRAKETKRGKPIKTPTHDKNSNDFKKADESIRPQIDKNVLSENEVKILDQIKSINLTLFNSINKLNTFQQRAVLSDDKKILVSAMVGSGKTTVLVHKVLYSHFIKGIPLDKVAILTFTNKAANEIIERILSFYIGQDSFKPDLSLCGTFHSVAKNILSNSDLLDSIGYTDSFTIMDENEKITFLKRIVSDNNLNIKYVNKVDKRIDSYRNPKPNRRKNKILYGNMKYEDDLEKLITLASFNKKQNNVMDFDDIIHNVNIIMSDKSHDLKLDWIIIDEFQDSNVDQINMVNNMASEKTKIFAVGDPNQLIYAWRGSDITIFSDFKREQCVEYSLPINYRSTSNILDLAKVVKTYGGDELFGIRSSGTPVRIINHYDSNQEAIYVASQIKKLIQQGVPLREIAILFRTRNQSNIFETIFEKEEISFEVANRRTIRDIPPIYWLILLIKSCLNKYDMNSIYDTVFDSNYGFFKFSDKLIRNYVSITKTLEVRPDLHNFLEWLGVKKKKDKYFLKFSEKMLNFEKWMDSISFDRIPEIFDYFDLSLLLNPTSSNYEDDVEHVRQFLDDVSTYVQVDYDLNVKKSFLSIVSKMSLGGINIIGETIDPNSEKVKLLTIHTAKGLEFRYVFISGANNGLIPMGSDYQGAQFAEEKRLFFVAITRAKDFLEISYHTNPEGWNSSPDLSCFLRNIPKNVVRVGSEKKLLQFESDLDNSTIDKLDNWYKGQRITHHKYGNGEISNISESNIICHFDAFGEKSFSINFLPIMPNID